MGRRKSSWERYTSTGPKRRQYYDYFDNQNTERSQLAPDKSPTSRIIADAAMTFGVVFLVWLVYSIVQAAGDILEGTQQVNAVYASSYMHAVGVCMGRFTLLKVVTALGSGVLFFTIMYFILMRNLEVQTAAETEVDINQYPDDLHIAFPEEIQEKFDWFPDVGATSDIQFSSMISHMAISNKGLKTVQVARRAKADIVDEDGDVAVYKGEVLTDDDGNILFDEKPIIDQKFMSDLFEASGLALKELRFRYDTRKIPYNGDGRNRDKLGKFETVADLINADWEFPYYEPQRPAGAYIVDTAPVNTMVLAIKGI